MERKQTQAGKLPRDLARILPVIARRTGCDDWRVAAGSLVRRDCMIHFLESSSFRVPRIVLKVYDKQPSSEHMARNLHRRGTRYFEASTPVFSVPEPLIFIKHENAFAMEYVDAPTVGACLMRSLHSPATRRGLIRRSAAWLGWFYQHGGIQPQPFESSLVALRVGRLRGLLEDSAPGALAADRLLDDCLKLSVEIAGDLDGREIPHVAAHGDFTPFNLFAQGSRTVGFDFGAGRRLPLYHDMCRFLLYLDVYRPLPASSRDLSRVGCRAADLDGFMEAFGHNVPFEREVWLKLHFIEVTRRMVALKPPKPRWMSRCFRGLQSAVLRRAARRMMKGF